MESTDKQVYGIYKQLTTINSPHDDVVRSIRSKWWLSVNCICNLQLSSIPVDADPASWVCGLVVPDRG